MSTFPQLDTTVAGPTATLKTNKGDITIELFPEIAPRAVENFIRLSEEGYYNGVIFHRVIPEFMIQGGDPSGSGFGGESIWGKSFKDEFSDKAFNLHGALSMANSGPDSNGSQFFIVTAGPGSVPASFLRRLQKAGFPDEVVEAYGQKGGTPHLDGRHTVFGQVREGLENAVAISEVERNTMDKPLEDVVIESITIKEA